MRVCLLLLLFLLQNAVSQFDLPDVEDEEPEHQNKPMEHDLDGVDPPHPPRMEEPHWILSQIQEKIKSDLSNELEEFGADLRKVLENPVSNHTAVLDSINHHLEVLKQKVQECVIKDQVCPPCMKDKQKCQWNHDLIEKSVWKSYFSEWSVEHRFMPPMVEDIVTALGPTLGLIGIVVQFYMMFKDKRVITHAYNNDAMEMVNLNQAME